MKSTLIKSTITGLLFAASTFANAALINFSVNDTITQGGGSADVNGCSSGAVGAVIDGNNLMLDPGCSGAYLDLQLINGEFWVLGATENLAALSQGTVISNATFNSGGVSNWNYVLDSNVPSPDFTSSFQDMFLGFKTGSGKFGYIEIDWDYDVTSGVGTLFLGNGAYNSEAGIAIETPSSRDIPEPGSIALLSLALLGLTTRKGFKK